nr:immunoglobulin light chain junction region [Macaca mulatta]
DYYCNSFGGTSIFYMF